MGRLGKRAAAARFSVGAIVYVTFLVAWMRTQDAGAPLVAMTWAVLGLAVMASPFPWRRVLVASAGGARSAFPAPRPASVMLPMLADGAFGLVLSAAAFGLALFIAPTAITAFSRKNLSERQWGRSVALFTTAFAIGQIIGPVAAGWITERCVSVVTPAGSTFVIADRSIG